MDKVAKNTNRKPYQVYHHHHHHLYSLRISTCTSLSSIYR